MATYPQDYIPQFVKKHKVAASFFFIYAIIYALRTANVEGRGFLGIFVGSFIGLFVMLWIWSLVVEALSKKNKYGKK